MIRYTIAAALAAILLSVLPAHAGPLDHRLDASVPYGRWLARCSAVPVAAADGLDVMASYSRPGVRAWLLRDGLRYGVLVAYYLGDYSGIGVYDVHGPLVLRDRMAADATDCPQVVPWDQVTTLPAAAVTWIAARSVCCGAWTVGGESRTAVPCSWVTEGRATGTLAGYGPGVTAGTDPCEGYGGQ